MEQLKEKLEEITAEHPVMGLTRRERIEETKVALKELHQEWLDGVLRRVGRWSLRGLLAAFVAALIYFILTHSGWQHK